MPNPTASDSASIVCVIEPDRRGLLPDFREIWRYRELFWVLSLRDIQIRYKQTYLGVAWAVIVPLTQALIFTALFGLVGVSDKMKSSTVPFFLTAFCGTIVWQLFSSGAGGAANSILAASGMIKKVYFPRVIIPFSAMMQATVDFLISFALLLALMAACHGLGASGLAPTWRIAFLPVFAAMAAVTAMALGLWLSAMTAMWRDIRFVVPFLLQLGQYASPVFYETSAVVPKAWPVKVLSWVSDHGIPSGWLGVVEPRVIYGLNPMSGILEGFRWSLFGQGEAPGVMTAVSAAMVLLILVTGLWFFRRTERQFVDIL